MAETGDPSHPWRTDAIDAVLTALQALESVDEKGRFLRDLCTMSELEAMAHRWEVARLLDRGLPYHEVARRTGASTTTVTRVSHWLRYGEGGYRLALERTATASASA
ncbi:MAG: YerC/YecD family TrpR-related protein [Actinomycetota bacterium]|nr:YerC/YecD family TrpR-related protein [Actinomycetota bacterium]